ncbi:MAG: HAMP domain-containing sensor histidine kinase, partial [Patescibacteria group bacterium]
FGALDGNLRMPTERILESSNRLVAVVEDFLTISRIEQNRLAYSFQSVDFTRLIETIVGEMKPVAEKKGLTMSFTAPEGASCMVTADSGKITQAVTNLVDNAIKYTPQGEITITSKKNGTHSCLLSVRDTGVGMSDDAQKNVFSKFVRGENAKKENVTGAGLGLYIAKQLVEAHRGKIWGESKGEGKGSTFYLELPAEN